MDRRYFCGKSTQCTALARRGGRIRVVRIAVHIGKLIYLVPGSADKLRGTNNTEHKRTPAAASKVPNTF